jgi:hypothetical protein
VEESDDDDGGGGGDCNNFVRPPAVTQAHRIISKPGIVIDLNRIKTGFVLYSGSSLRG